MTRHISEGRKTAYYAGMVLTVVGMILFLSVFVTGAMQFGDFTNFDANARSSMFRAIAGMVLVIVGQFVRSIGARGLAGSGVILDPRRARGELEPYSRMAGGMLKDALDEAQLDPAAPGAKVVMIKCRSCDTLNEENSKFCQECGKPL